MIASQLATVSVMPSSESAFEHCKNYVEVTFKSSTFSGSIKDGQYSNATSGNSLNDWVV